MQAGYLLPIITDFKEYVKRKYKIENPQKDLLNLGKKPLCLDKP
jgi:hypothetical protein